MTSKIPAQPPPGGPPDKGPMPEDIRRFLLTSVSSVPYLEALLLLRSQPEAQWSARQVAQRLYVGEKAARELLEALVAAGIAAGAPPDAPRFSYRPASAALRVLLDGLADIYAHNLVEVTHLIHAKGDKRAHQFADAFRWRKDS